MRSASLDIGHARRGHDPRIKKPAVVFGTAACSVLVERATSKYHAAKQDPRKIKQRATAIQSDLKGARIDHDIRLDGTATPRQPITFNVLQCPGMSVLAGEFLLMILRRVRIYGIPSLKLPHP